VYRLRTPKAQTEPAAKAEPNLRHIGFVGVTRRAWYDELRRSLAAYGYVDGQTTRIRYRWSEGDLSRYPDLVKELLDLPVELIVATGTPPVAAEKQMTSTIPIIFVEVGDPVGYGIVPSLARPGGNMTGQSNNLYEYAPRSLRLFKDIVPEASASASCVPRITRGAGWIKSMEAVSQALDMVPRVYHANTADELRLVLPGIDARTDVLVAPSGDDHLGRHGIEDPGGLPAAGIRIGRRAAVVRSEPRGAVPAACPLCRRGSQGALPSDLPIEEPAKSWLMINLRSAKSLSIEIPGPILMRADQIIE
jgi:putative ABC transport system substrate-binding protein